MRYLIAFIVALAAPALAALAPAFHDGDFSAAPDPGSFTTYAKGSTAIPGWTVTKATIDLIGGHYWKTPGGKRSIDMDGTPGFGAIAQTFATTPGKKYTVSFLLSGNAGDEPTIKRLRVGAAGKHADYTFDITSQSAQNGNWVKESWSFVATSSSTTLQFESKDTTGGKCGPVIAAVSVR